MPLTYRSQTLRRIEPIARVAAASTGIAGHLVDEATQRTLLALMPHVERLEAMAPEERRLFVWKTAARLARRVRRQEARAPSAVSAEGDEGAFAHLLAGDASPSERLDLKRRLAHAEGAYCALDREDRAILRLVGDDGLSERAVAEALDLSRGTVVYRLRRARAALERAWAKATAWMA